MSEQLNHRQQIRAFSVVAGSVYLLLIILYMSGEYLIGSVVDGVELERLSAVVQQRQFFYRSGIILQIITPIFTVVLAYALYVLARQHNKNFALMAMIWRLGEAFIGAVTTIFTFTIFHFYLNYEGELTVHSKLLIDLLIDAKNVGFNISVMFFGVGSTLFFVTFLRANILPVGISIFGAMASVLAIVTAMLFMVLPGYSAVVQYGWAPMFVSEIVTGVWLLIKGAKSIEFSAHQ